MGRRFSHDVLESFQQFKGCSSFKMHFCPCFSLKSSPGVPSEILSGIFAKIFLESSSGVFQEIFQKNYLETSYRVSSEFHLVIPRGILPGTVCMCVCMYSFTLSFKHLAGISPRNIRISSRSFFFLRFIQEFFLGISKRFILRNSSKYFSKR